MAAFNFTASGTYTPAAGVTLVDVIIVGGGGSGGKHPNGGGGGGGGGVRLIQGVAVTPGVGIPVTVGAGGAAQTTASTNGNPGGDSVFGALTALGGAGGGGTAATAPSGASGGGGIGDTVTAQAGGAGTAGQGFAGGTGSVQGASTMGAGGGGGANGVGANGGFKIGGAGGPGLSLAAFTSLLGGVFGGGGGGGTPGSTGSAQSAGGAGGGAAGGNGGTGGGTGTANLGGGGGGSGNNTTNSGAGGSGVVIVLVPEARLASLQTQVAMVVDPATISARLGALMTQVAIYTIPRPTAVTATQISSTQIDLAWAAPIDGKPLLRYEVNIDGGPPIGKGSALSHSFTGLTPYSTHEVGVRFLDTEGNVSDYVYRGMVLLPAPSDNPFSTDPLKQGTPGVQVALRMPGLQPFVGAGKEVQDQPDFVGSVTRDNAILIVQGGVTKQVPIDGLLPPDPERMRTIGSNVSQGNTAGAGVIVGAPQLALPAGTYKFKYYLIGRGNVTSNDGSFWPELVSGTASRFLWTEIFQTSGGAAATGSPRSQTTDTPTLVEGKAARVANVAQNNMGTWASVTVEYLFICRGVIVASTDFVLGVRIKNSVGGGNNNIIFEGSNIKARRLV